MLGEPHVEVTEKEKRNALILAADECGFGLGVIKMDEGYWFSEDVKMDELKSKLDDEELVERLPNANPVSKA